MSENDVILGTFREYGDNSEIERVWNQFEALCDEHGLDACRFYEQCDAGKHLIASFDDPTQATAARIML